jgi:hypothetical protein
MLIEDIIFHDFTGTSKKYDPTVGTLVCSNQTVRRPPFSEVEANRDLTGMSEHCGHEHQYHESKWEGSSMDLQECGQEYSCYKLCLKGMQGRKQVVRWNPVAM